MSYNAGVHAACAEHKQNEQNEKDKVLHDFVFVKIAFI